MSRDSGENVFWTQTSAQKILAPPRNCTKHRQKRAEPRAARPSFAKQQRILPGDSSSPHIDQLPGTSSLSPADAKWTENGHKTATIGCQRMKRRWSNNGGFMRLPEESSSEVTSSSNGLVLPSGVNMSPSSLDSHDYCDQDLWLCGNESGSFGGSNGHGLSQQQQSVITLAMHGCSSTLPAQTTIIPINGNANGNGGSTNGQYVPGATNLGALANGMLNGGLNGMQQQIQNGHGLINSTTPSTPTTPLHLQQNLGGAGGGGIGGMGILHHANGTPNGLIGVVGGGGGVGLGVGGGGVGGLGMQHTPRSDSVNSISSGKIYVLYRQSQLTCIRF